MSGQTTFLSHLAGRVKAMEARMATISRAQAPEPETWAVWARVRQNVLFLSSKGRLETLPGAVVDLLARGEPLDCEVSEVTGEKMRFLSPKGKEIGRIPKSLANALTSRGLLKEWPRGR